MNDSERIRLATKQGSKMLGPIERERCSKHRRRWVIYRWIWPVGSDPSSSEPHIVRGCVECNNEHEASDDE